MRKVYRVLTVVGAALGLLAFGTVALAQQPPPPKPEPPSMPKITPQQIIDGVNQLIPQVSFITLRGRGIPLGRTPMVDDGPIDLAFPREGVRLSKCISLDDGPIWGRQAGGTRLGAIELEREYKLGSNPLKKGYYHIVAIYDPNNELDADSDPKNERDFFLALVNDSNGDGQIDATEIHAFMGLPHWALARVMEMVDPRIQIEFAQVVLLNLIAALLQ